MHDHATPLAETHTPSTMTSTNSLQIRVRGASHSTAWSIFTDPVDGKPENRTLNRLKYRSLAVSVKNTCRRHRGRSTNRETRLGCRAVLDELVEEPVGDGGVTLGSMVVEGVLAIGPHT